MIQGSINQLLSMAAIGTRLTPGYESRVEARKATKQIADTEAQLAQVTHTSEEGTVTANITQELLENRAQASESLFRAKPTKETYRQYVISRAEQEAEAAQRIRQQELARVREALTANAPTTYGRRDKI
jgi:hypothetical protein